MGRGACEPRLVDEAVTPLAEAMLRSAEQGALKGYVDEELAEIGVARRFTYVVTREGRVGLAYPWAEEPLPRRLAEARQLRDILLYAWQHPAATSAALAAAAAATQALLEEQPGLVSWGSGVEEALPPAPARVALVGYVKGVASLLRSRGYAVTVYEDSPMHRREAEAEGLETRPGAQLVIEASRYQAVVATGASLLTPCLYAALSQAHVAPALVLVGPTASIPPDALPLPVAATAGSYYPPETRAELLLRVRLGQGFRRISWLARKWLWRSGSPS